MADSGPPDALLINPSDSSIPVTIDARLSGTIINSVRITHYTLVTEAETSGQRSGDRSMVCNPPNLTGCFYREFLCSGYGVAMQGTGYSSGGMYIKYVRGGGGWLFDYSWLTDCSTAVFASVAGVTGASGRMLIEDYSIAVDPSVFPLGSSVWIDGSSHWYRADDTGGAIIGSHIDIYVGLQRNYPALSGSRVFVTSLPRNANDPSPY